MADPANTRALLDQPLDAFLAYLADERRYSPKTVASYRRDLAGLRDWLLAKALNDWSDLQPAHLRRYIALRHREGLGSRSLQRLLSATRSFYRYLQKQGRAARNPAADAVAPKAPKRLPKTIDHEQIERLLVIPGNDPLAIRDRALMELFYSSGLRLAELASLDRAALDLSAGLARIEKGKGAKTRIVPVGSKARQALHAWLKARPDLMRGETDALFLSRNGHRLSHRAIQQRLKYWAVRQGLDQTIHPHRLRHAFASHLLESSGDIRAVQELLGHANISSTQIYTHLDFQHLAEVYDKAHPRARKR